VPLLPEASRVLEGLRPAEDRVADQPVLPGLTDNALRSALRVASKRAGVPLYTPQDFRRRYVSLLIMAGVPATIVRMIVGHRRIAVTIDTYSRVLMDEPIDRLRELREAAYRVPGVAPIGQATRPVGDSAVTGEPS
jgi:integrase